MSRKSNTELGEVNVAYFGNDFSHKEVPRNNNEIKDKENIQHGDEPNNKNKITCVEKPEATVEDIEAEFEDEDDVEETGCLLCISGTQRRVEKVLNRHGTMLKRIFLLVLLLLYFAYFIYCMIYRFGDEGSIRLLWVTCFAVVLLVSRTVREKYKEPLNKKAYPIVKIINHHSKRINTFCLSCIFLAFVIMIIYDLATQRTSPYNLVSLCGIGIYVFLCFITSAYPSRIKWKTVAWGFGLQAALAMIILRWHGGYMVFKWIGDRLDEYFNYIDVSCEFVFGPSFRDHFFAFKVVPLILFVGSTISILFYLGVTHWLIMKISKVMEISMGTTAGESVNAAANIFIGQVEISILLKSLIAKMTMSEIHAVMVGGFSTVAGTVLATFILFGIPGNHLVSASMISAPAALAISKISFPETKKSKTLTKDVNRVMGTSPDKSLVEAASSGAITSVPLAVSIAVHIIAFRALLEFVNSTLMWFGERAGSPVPITFKLLCSYLFWIFAFLMGVPLEDCRNVAGLIGVKIFVNEFVAFDNLGVLTNNKRKFDSHLASNGTWSYTNFGNDILLHNFNSSGTTTLLDGFITAKSTVIATYALCGFSNFTSIGIQMGALMIMVPNRKAAFAKLAVRCMWLGNVVCFVTACIAGLFYQDEDGL